MNVIMHLLARFSRLTLAISTANRKIKWLRRCSTWNQQPEVFVSTKVGYIADSVKLQMRPEDCDLGGSIHISAGIRISEGVIIAPFGGSVFIDEDVYIGPYCILYGHGGLKIGKNSLIAGHTMIIPANHVFADVQNPIKAQYLTQLGVTIGEDVWIGGGVKVLDGVTIGRGCVIGAGAVINKSLPEFSIAVGVPARIIGNRKDQARSEAIGLSELHSVYQMDLIK